MNDHTPGGPPAADGIELRIPTPETLRHSLSPLLRAFAFEWTDADWDVSSRTIEPDRVLAAWDGDEPVGSAGAVTVRLTVPGGEVAAAGVTLVGVTPSHRRRGILRRLMRRQLDDIHALGEPVAILWASEGAIYQRFGYGLAAFEGRFDIERTWTAFSRTEPPQGRVRMADGEDAIRLMAGVYDRQRVATPGEISRTDDWWRWDVVADSESRRQGASPKYFAVYEVDGVPEGYAFYRVRGGWDDRGPKSELLVRECIATTPRAERDLWRWLFDIDLVGRIRADRVPVPPPVLHLLAEPRRLGLTMLDGLWLRIVDLPAALSGRRYAAADDLVLEVADLFCPWNEGRWRIRTGDGDAPAVPGPSRSASVEPTAAPPDLALGAADLGAAYLGGVPFRDLAAAGRVVEVTHGAAARADALFAGDRTPRCSTPF